MSKPLPTRPEPTGAEKKPAAPAPAPKPKAPKKPSPWPWAPWLRVLVSLFVAFHILAVFSAPWLIQNRDIFAPPWPPDRPWLIEDGRVVPREQIDRTKHPTLRLRVPEALAGPESAFPIIYHYANLLYINNGYDFFSPDPVGSYIIKYEVFDSMGQTIKAGEFPDANARWPRLLYHRYMMLADQSSTPRPDTDGWKQKIADRLMAKYGGASATLKVVRHFLLTPEELLAGRRLDEPATYQELESVKYVPSLPPPAADAAAASVAIPGAGR